jgi:hypothetical protein
VHVHRCAGRLRILGEADVVDVPVRQDERPKLIDGPTEARDDALERLPVRRKAGVDSR